MAAALALLALGVAAPGAEALGEPIPVGDHPNQVAISPDGSAAYVVNSYSNSVSVIDTATDQQLHSPIEVGENPIDLAITPDGRKLYVANHWNESISVIDTATDQTVGEIPTASPNKIELTADGSKAYVTTNADSGAAC